ncbi:uncharacterized protein LOC8281221 [Ricinus communis]|uniref:Membrane lipoprotein n=1 Tax=Ricinus communis TaxID=3988 RepID=B9RRE9_RICCO|nr:uncharacterized protein LOC8281221 [Ricinus communis]EEF46065.1 conserved hypothetical protein [Ricinus communis]|eukprot:XP_002516318.1 uncharacterized protein LOC8281221 [Ricinus communis]
MPVADPISGRLFIWLISCFLFLSIAIGGTFLILYILLPPDASRSWLPIAGVILVCLPWVFWCITCLYRIFSRALGFRVVLGGGGGGGGNSGRAHPNVSSCEPTNIESSLEQVEEGDGKHVKFGEAVVVGDTDDYGNGGENNANLRGLSGSISGNDLSISSHESEMPLTSSMAS